MAAKAEPRDACAHFNVHLYGYGEQQQQHLSVHRIGHIDRVVLRRRARALARILSDLLAQTRERVRDRAIINNAYRNISIASDCKYCWHTAHDRERGHRPNGPTSLTINLNQNL